MENNETELLIDKKVAEAKLEVAEKRLQFVMWVGGVVLPCLVYLFRSGCQIRHQIRLILP